MKSLAPASACILWAQTGWKVVKVLMQISTTRTTRSTRNIQGGFTLIETLIVVAMLGILTSVVVINFSTGDSAYRIRADLDRFTSVVEMARHRAMMRNRDWGIHINQ